jgi:cytochrome bd-type quinol oxidase subunit 1
MGGCTTLAPRTSQTLQTGPLADKIQGLTNVVTNAPEQVVNQLWPLVVMVSLIFVVLTGGAVFLIRHWINSHSYLRQKPEWIRLQNGGTGDAPRN